MKKIISLLLALCLLSACVLALAADSKTAGGGTVVVNPGYTGGETVTEPEATEEPAEEEETIVSLAPAAEEFVAKFQAIGEGESILTPFAEATQEAARALCETADGMNLIEASAISIDGELYEGGPLTVTLDYDEDFTQFNDILVIICANENEFVAEPEVTEEGDLQLELAEEVITNILNDAEACLAVLAD